MEDEPGGRVAHGALQPYPGGRPGARRGPARRRDGIRGEIEHHPGEAPGARQELGRAAGGLGPSAGADPEERAQRGPGGGGARGIEGVDAIDERDQITGRGRAGEQRRDEAAPPADRGPTISLSWPRGNASSKEAMLSRPHPGGGKDSFAMAM